MRKVFRSISGSVSRSSRFVPLAPLLVAGTETLVEMRTAPDRRSRVSLSSRRFSPRLQRNADIQKARQEIERTKGLYIQVRAEILPQVDIDHQHSEHRSASRFHLDGLGRRPLRSADPIQRFHRRRPRCVFAGGRIISNIRAAAFTRDSSYYAFRNAIDHGRRHGEAAVLSGSC